MSRAHQNREESSRLSSPSRPIRSRRGADESLRERFRFSHKLGLSSVSGYTSRAPPDAGFGPPAGHRRAPLALPNPAGLRGRAVLARPSARRVLGRRVSACHKNSAASCFCNSAASAPQPFFRPLMRVRRPVLSLGVPWAAPGAFTGHQTACWCSCGLVRVGVRGRVNRGLERTAAGATARAHCLYLPAGAQTRAMGAQQVYGGPGAPQQAFAFAKHAVGAVRLCAAASAILERRAAYAVLRTPPNPSRCAAEPLCTCVTCDGNSEVTTLRSISS